MQPWRTTTTAPVSAPTSLVARVMDRSGGYEQPTSRTPLLAIERLREGQTRPFRAAPALKVTVFLAGMCSGSPVWGLCPMRSLRILAWKVPKP